MLLDGALVPPIGMNLKAYMKRSSAKRGRNWDPFQARHRLVQEQPEEAVVESQLGLAGDQGGCGGVQCHVRRLDTVIMS